MNGYPVRGQRTQRSAALRAKLAVIRGTTHGARAMRYRNRQLHQPLEDVQAATVIAMPDWLLSTAEEQTGLAKAIAILLHRPAIDSELSGTKLAALSDAVGEQLFDTLCDHPLPGDIPEPISRDLPRPEDLEAIGRDHMQRAIPLALSAKFAGAKGEQLCAALCATAATLTLQSEAKP